MKEGQKYSEEDRQRNLQYLNNLADIPKTSEKIFEEDGVAYLTK